MNQQIDTIIFDLGGVLVDWNPEYVYRNVFKNDPDKMHWFLNNVCNSDWNIEQDAGRTIAEANKIKIAEYPEFEKEIILFYEKWEYMFSGPFKENVELLVKLKASNNYKLYALTNWSAEKWDKALELFPFFKLFDGVVVSGKEKCRKPFPEIFEILFKRYLVNPETTIFIDDNFENIQSALLLKLNAIHLPIANELTEKLKPFNLKY